MREDNLRAARRMLLSNGFFLLVVSLLPCVAAPYLLTVTLSRFGLDDPVASQTAIPVFCAVALGFWLNRNISALPGTSESASILPSYTFSFGVTLTAILILRFEYSRLFMISGYLVTLAWFYAIYLIIQRRFVLLLGVVEGGQTQMFGNLAHVATVPLSLDDWPGHLDAVTADLRHHHDDRWEARLADYVLGGIAVYHSKDLYESLSGRTDIEHLSENNLGKLGPMVSFQIAKQIIDRLLAIPALVVTGPIILAAMVAVKLDSPGPALFRQRRVGFRGKEFEVLKLRTMRTEATARERKLDDLITVSEDPRVTRLGRFLRRTRIDELPQIINILRGEMSWIGPRPEAKELSEWYERSLPFYRYRHVVMPGITGWAQVSQGHVAELSDVSDKLKYDFFYIRNFSISLDLLIIAKTIKTMLTGFGSK
jgi:lipopolysaccharide/colanic/teichoic acid biosynthesis glycosyltransferase